MRIFQSDAIKKKGQITGYNILIIDGEKQYNDTAENFKLDGGADIDKSIIYNDDDGICVIDNQYKKYPNDNFNSYIDSIDTFIAAKEQRTYVEPPEPTLDELKVAKLAEIDAWTAAKITGGFVSEASGEPVTYDSDKDTQLTMQGIALNVNSETFAENYSTGCPVRGYPEGSDTKQIFMLTPSQVMQWCADLSMHIGTCKQAGWAKQEEVAAAQSKEDLEAIALT